MPIDLKAAVEQVSREYFGGTLHPNVRWGKAPKRAQRAGKFILAYFENSKYRITLHPMFKSERVPRGIVLYLLHHEMLHITWGGPKHSAGFREAERAHPDYWRAEKWLGDNICSLSLECGRRK